MTIDILTDIYSRMREFERSHGISALELHCILELLKEDGQRLVTLGNKIGSPTAISENIVSLEAKGWVLRERMYSGNSRMPIVRVYLTDKGIALSGEFEQLQRDIEALALRNRVVHP